MAHLNSDPHPHHVKGHFIAPRCLVVGNIENRRVQMFQDALRECHCQAWFQQNTANAASPGSALTDCLPQPAIEVAYADVLQSLCNGHPFPFDSVLPRVGASRGDGHRGTGHVLVGPCANADQTLTQGSNEVVVRLESAGESFDVERMLIAVGAPDFTLGASSAGAVAAVQSSFVYIGAVGERSLSKAEALALPHEHGRIVHPAQWWRGFTRLVRYIARGLTAAGAHAKIRVAFMNDPEEVLCLFDKAKVNALLHSRGVVVPPLLFRDTTCHAALRAAMLRDGVPRVFVKLAHGSSASGVVAYECWAARSGGVRECAVTSMECVRPNQLPADGAQGHGGGGTNEGPAFYNSLRVRRYTDPAVIAMLIDYLFSEGLTIEQWLPKATQNGVPFDLRVVVIDGEPCHWVVRLGTSGPMTNLHLGNMRGSCEQFLAECPPEIWGTVLSTCRAVATVFPRSLYLGVDVLITANYEDVVVLEVNAFGDLLPRILHRGVDTYTSEVQALMCEYEARCDVQASEQRGGEGDNMPTFTATTDNT